MFIESIKIFNGKVFNLDLHQARVDLTASSFDFPRLVIPDLLSLIPLELKKKLVKCRLTYNTEILSLEFIPYEKPNVRSLSIIEADSVSYSYKYSDRESLKSLYKKRAYCDDILIVKGGKICDTYFANVVFEKNNKLTTPNSYLLNGTKRQSLINKGLVCEEEICLLDLPKYEKVYLVNSMLDIEDNVQVSIDNIFR